MVQPCDALDGSPGIYDAYNRTPGYRGPPRWYLAPPAGLRALLLWLLMQAAGDLPQQAACGG